MRIMHKYKRLIMILLVTGSATAIVGILAIRALHLNDRPFSRTLLPVSATIIKTMKKHEKIHGIAGTDGSQIYFSTKNPEHLISTDYNTTDWSVHKTPFKATKKSLHNFNFIIDSLSIQLLAGNEAALYIGNMNDTLVEKFTVTPGLFTQGIKTPSGSYIFRAFDPRLKSIDQVFLKVHPYKGILYKNEHVTPLRDDAGISTDGMLHFDDRYGNIVYVSYYTNHIYLLDTSLQLLLKTKTIDNTELIPAFTGRVGNAEKSRITNIAPKRIINARSHIADGELFIESRLKSDSESSTAFSENVIIDRYQLKDFKYKNSFYIPDYNKQTLNQFQIIDGKLVVLYQYDVVIYDIPI